MCPGSSHSAPSSQVWSQKVQVPSKLSHHSWTALPPPPEAWQPSHTQRLEFGTRSAMRSASGTGEERERQWLGRPASWARAEQGTTPRTPRELLSPLHTQEAPAPSNATSLPPLPPCWQGKEVFVWIVGREGGVGKNLIHPNISQAWLPPPSQRVTNKTMRGTYQQGQTFLWHVPTIHPSKKVPLELYPPSFPVQSQPTWFFLHGESRSQPPRPSPSGHLHLL